MGSPAWLTKDEEFVDPQLPNPGPAPALHTAATVRYVTKKRFQIIIIFLVTVVHNFFFSQKAIHCIITRLPPSQEVLPCSSSEPAWNHLSGNFCD